MAVDQIQPSVVRLADFISNYFDQCASKTTVLQRSGSANGSQSGIGRTLVSCSRSCRCFRSFIPYRNGLLEPGPHHHVPRGQLDSHGFRLYSKAICNTV